MVKMEPYLKKANWMDSRERIIAGDMVMKAMVAELML